MSFARRILIAAILIQVLGFLREIVFALGLEQYFDSLTSLSDPTIVVATGVFAAALALVWPVARGNRWATLATIPVMAVLLLAIVPAFATFFASPTSSGFAVWFTITSVLAAALVGIPFAVIATLESFGRRAPSSALRRSGGFGGGVLFLTAMVGSVAGMTMLAVAVAATPNRTGEAAVARPPDATVAMTLRDLRFEPGTLSVAADATTAVFVTNDDAFAHSFDVDELDIHVPIAAGQTVLVMLEPIAASSFRLYCGIPGHAEGGMVAELLVE